MSEHVLPNEFRCSYAFKFCNNQRAFKKSGERHKMCQEHRDKANKHQQALAARRKQIKEQVAAASNNPRPDERLVLEDILDLLDDNTFLGVSCTEDDLRAIDILLSDTDTE